MPEYKNGKIYKIVSNHMPDTCYIGSTIQPLCKRFGGHRSDYRKHLKGGKKYMTSFKLVCYPDARVYLIESYACNNKNELERREGEIIKEYMKNYDLENPVNKAIAGRTGKEYYVDNKEKINEKKKQYYDNNKDEILEHHKQYYHNNKKEINERRKIKVNCEYCNLCIRKEDIRAHQRSKKCQSFQ